MKLNDFNMFSRLRVAASVALVMTFLSAYAQEQGFSELQYFSAPKAQAQQSYYFAVHPLYNPERQQKAYQPLIDYLNSNIPEVHFKLEASRDYQAYEAKIYAKTPEFLLPNPWQTLQASNQGLAAWSYPGCGQVFSSIRDVERLG